VTGSRMLVTPSKTGGSNMVIRDSIFYAFTKSRDNSDVALVFIATKLSRMVESPEREDSYLDLIGYSAILGFCRFSSPEDWDDVESDSQL
jgi:hypothetical protein